MQVKSFSCKCKTCSWQYCPGIGLLHSFIRNKYVDLSRTRWMFIRFKTPSFMSINAALLSDPWLLILQINGMFPLIILQKIYLKIITIWTICNTNITLRHLQYGSSTRTPSVITVTSLKQSCLKYSCPTFSHYLPPNSIRCPLLCCLILLCCICSMRDCFICGWPNFQVWSRRSAETV